jgi:hypothetical protein
MKREIIEEKDIGKAVEILDKYSITPFFPISKTMKYDKYELQNTTNVSDAKLREMIAFVKPNNLPTSTFDIRVTTASSEYCGCAYTDGYYNGNRPHIIVRVTKNENEFPRMVTYGKTHRRIKNRYQKFNEKKGIFETWIHTHYEKLPTHKQTRIGGYIDHLTLSREEAFIHILAHELRHLWQKNHRTKRGKVWGARGRFSDRDADAYAIRKQREWRRLHTPKEVFPNMDILNL